MPELSNSNIILHLKTTILGVGNSFTVYNFKVGSQGKFQNCSNPEVDKFSDAILKCN